MKTLPLLPLILLMGTLMAYAPLMEEPPGPARPLADPGAYPEPVELPSTQPQATFARRGMVAAAHPLAARAGVEILKAGGNAIDAAITVQLVLNLVEPQSSGIGGGCFIVFYRATDSQVYCLDGREETPAGATREQFLDHQGRVRRDALVGGACVGVPGTLAALYAAHERFGALSWREVIAPAITLAKKGLSVTPRLRLAIATNRERFLLFPASRELFLINDAVPELGDILPRDDFAYTLEQIAKHGPKFFYSMMSPSLENAVKRSPVHPGTLSEDDLQRYQPIWREPVRFKYRGYEIVGMPPPSSGTLTLGEILALAEAVPPEQRRPGSLGEADWFARAESVAFADRNAWLGDPAFSDYPMHKLLEPQRLMQRHDELKRLRPGQKAKPGPRPGDGAPGPALPLNPREGENTTHFSIVDAGGNVVSFTTTIEHGMGSGLAVPGAGFLLNNELTDFDLDRTDGPNALENRRVARPGGGEQGKRPRSSMTPLIVFQNGDPYLTLGSPGGSRIIGIVGQTLLGVLDHDLDIQAAINLPRVSCRNRGKIQLEGHHPNRRELVTGLERLGWTVEELPPDYAAWGGAHGIRILPEGRLEGGADPRREGVVRGW